MVFAERLKELRESHKPKIYQKELADAIGVSRQAITMWETGQRIPESETLQKLADFFNCSTDYLLGRTNKPNPDNKINEEYILQAATLGDALIRLAELTFEIDIDDETFANLVIKARNKYGLPGGGQGSVAAHGPSYPGSGALEHLIPDEDRSYKKRKERARKKNYNKPHGDDNK